MVWLGESSGARLPDNQGSRGMGTMLGNDPTQYQRMRGNALGLGDPRPMLRLVVPLQLLLRFQHHAQGRGDGGIESGLVELATRQKIEPEELGGWRVHAEITGMIDMVADTDEEALDAIKRFLGYMPGHHKEVPPRAAVRPDRAPDGG